MLLPLAEEFKKAGLQDTPVEFEEPRNWYLLLTETGHDNRAWWWLHRAGHQAYWPNYAKQVRQAHGRRIERHYSLLPGYLPIALKENWNDWENLRQSPYVRDVFKSDGHPARLRDSDIKAIRLIEHKLSMPIVETEQWRPQLGQSVRFLVDLWNDLSGIVIAVASGHRIIVEMGMLSGGRIPVTVTSAQIAPI